MHQPFLNYNLNTSGEGLDLPASNSHIWQCQKSNIWLLLPSTVRERCQGSTEPRSDLAQPPSRREGGSKQSLSQLRVGKFKSGGFFFFLHLHYHGWILFEVLKTIWSFVVIRHWKFKYFAHVPGLGHCWPVTDQVPFWIMNSLSLWPHSIREGLIYALCVREQPLSSQKGI